MPSRRPSAPAGAVVSAALFLCALSACGASRTKADGTQASASAADAAPDTSSTGATNAGASAGDGGSQPYAGPWVESIILQAPVMSEMEWPNDRKAERENRVSTTRLLGYLRYGERTPALAEPHRKSNCSDGWYELVAGGFACGKHVTTDLEHPKLKEITPPDLEGPLPYAYGINLWNGTPLYRQVPSRQQRLKTETWLSAKPKRAKTEDPNPYDQVTALADAGTPDGQASGGIGEGAGDKPDAPWWEKEVPDGGPPSITLEDLQESGPVVRRMVKGFYLSLDHQFSAGGGHWWKTVAGHIAPFDRIMIAKPVTDFHGLWLNREEATYATKSTPSRRIDKLPVGFVLTRWAKRYNVDAPHKKVTATEGPLDRFQAVGLTGAATTIAGYEYWETDEGWWLRATDGTKTEPIPVSEKLGEHDKWIDVNLKRQTLVAFEGQTPVFVTLFSSGRNEHETPPGSFHIREKHIAATMDGDADIATDGPYSIEDVPYIEYFNGGYALHGAFWHASFGSVKSHGCVNLAPLDAKEIFGWTDPQLPEGWHAVFASKDRPGTRVIVHETAPGTCKSPDAEPPQCPETRP
jgi:hypothetical protein